jgi:hypothetical protein
MDIRVLRPEDIPHVQLANITNLPENYFCKYYLYHAMSWPQLSYVAVDVSLTNATHTCSVMGCQCEKELEWKKRNSSDVLPQISLFPRFTRKEKKATRKPQPLIHSSHASEYPSRNLQ